MSDDDTDEESDAPLVQVHLLKGEGERAVHSNPTQWYTAYTVRYTEVHMQLTPCGTQRYTVRYTARYTAYTARYTAYPARCAQLASREATRDTQTGRGGPVKQRRSVGKSFCENKFVLWEALALQSMFCLSSSLPATPFLHTDSDPDSRS